MKYGKTLEMSSGYEPNTTSVKIQKHYGFKTKTLWTTLETPMYVFERLQKEHDEKVTENGNA